MGQFSEQISYAMHTCYCLEGEWQRLSALATCLILGRVYADLDTDCVRGSDELFALYNVSTVPSLDLVSTKAALTEQGAKEQSSGDAVQKCFFGRMGSDEEDEHNIPNAWMASVPGHNFFKYMLQHTKELVMSGDSLDSRPEAVTGPIALRHGIEEFRKSVDEEGEKQEYEEILEHPLETNGIQRDPIVEVLPFHYIYPYSWGRDGDVFREVCSAQRDTFNAQRCKALIAVDQWPSYTITYWSHTWSWEGHDEDSLQRISS
jgi:hypothetical protein